MRPEHYKAPSGKIAPEALVKCSRLLVSNASRRCDHHRRRDLRVAWLR
jgi:hypothetical protein